MNIIDGDSHFMEPLDLFERYIDPAYRDRTVRVADDPANGKRAMLCDNRPMKLRDVDEVLGLLCGYGQKEDGRNAGNFDRYSAFTAQWQDMDARVRFMDSEEITAQVIYPSLGIIWEGELEEPMLADALCRAYNRWAFELVEKHKNRLYPAAHISIRDPALAVAELNRAAKAGARTAFISAAPINGRFPRLRVGTIESMAGWVGEWLERVDYRYRYMGDTSEMKRPISEYFARNIWVSAAPEEKMFKYIVQFAGDEKVLSALTIRMPKVSCIRGPRRVNI